MEVLRREKFRISLYNVHVLLCFSQDLQDVQEDVSESLRVALIDCSQIEKENVTNLLDLYLKVDMYAVLLTFKMTQAC